MNIEQKRHLEQLKRRNKEKQRQMKIENNVLFLECEVALGTAGKLLEQEEKDIVYCLFNERVPFLPWGIDWKQFNLYHIFDKAEEIQQKCKCKDFYIIWCKELPIIKSDIFSIIKNIDDICAVEPDTWLFSVDYSEIIEFHHDGTITFGMLKTGKEEFY